MHVDLEKLKKWKKQNAQERLEFIDYWVEYIKTHSDEEWSRQQNVLIDSQIKTSRALNKKISGLRNGE